MSAASPGLSDRLRKVWAATRLDPTRLGRGRYRRARQLLIGLPAIASALVTPLRSRASLQAENLALRHQLAVYERSRPRTRLHPADRVL